MKNIFKNFTSEDSFFYLRGIFLAIMWYCIYFLLMVALSTLMEGIGYSGVKFNDSFTEYYKRVISFEFLLTSFLPLLLISTTISSILYKFIQEFNVLQEIRDCRIRANILDNVACIGDKNKIVLYLYLVSLTLAVFYLFFLFVSTLIIEKGSNLSDFLDKAVVILVVFLVLFSILSKVAELSYERSFNLSILKKANLIHVIREFKLLNSVVDLNDFRSFN